MSEQACQAEPSTPKRVRLTTFLRPVLRRISARRSGYGDEKPLGLGPFWLHVYRWGSCTFGTGEWYEDWNALVGWRDGHRSFLIGHAREESNQRKGQA